MEFLTWRVLLTVCPLVFVAGFVDAVGGGGGLISMPAYLIAGLPPHVAIATNKLSAACGTSIAAFRFAGHKLIDWKLTIPGIVMAILGSGAGANISIVVNEKIMIYVLYAILPISAIIVLNKDLFSDNVKEINSYSIGKTWLIVGATAFVIGFYDGFYGPGTGTFLIIAFTVFAKMDMAKANGMTKAINLTTNITSLVIFILNGKVMVLLGLIAAVCNMLGGYLGAEMAISKGGKITRPIILFVLFLLLIKIIVQIH